MLVYEDMVQLCSTERVIEFFEKNDVLVTRHQFFQVLEISNPVALNKHYKFEEGKDYITISKSEEPALFLELIRLEIISFNAGRVTLYPIELFIDACLRSNSSVGADMRKMAVGLLKTMSKRSRTIMSITNGRDANKKVQLCQD